MSLESRKILVADTDLEFIANLKAALEAQGYSVMTMTNGLQATNIVDSENVAGIVTNVKLQSMSGMQVAGAARRSRFNRKVPIVLLADVADEEVLSRAKQIGVAHVIVKPATVEDVLLKLWGGPKAKPDQKSAEGAYDVRIMNTFMESMSDVLEFYFKKKPTIGKAAVKGETSTFGYLSAMISFTGETVKGSMAMSFEQEFLVALAKKVFPDSPFDGADVMMADLAGEMVNQVCGSVKTKFATLGLKVMIGLPKVVIGKDHKIIHLLKNPVIWVPVAVDETRCAIEFCMDRSGEAGGPPEGGAGDGDAKAGDVLMF